MTTAVETKTWTGRHGQTRHYVQNIADIADELAGGLSNSKRRQAERSKVWIDESGEVHVDQYALSAYAGFGETELVAFIAASLSEAPASVGGEEAHSSLYGDGVRYADMPGATHYRGASGEYSVQIWDES